MPAHISHLLFAEDALREATTGAGTLLEDAGNLFRLGAQGPDLFYHNQRTRPVALRYGSLIHRRGFGTLVAHMARTAIAGAQRTGRVDVAQAAFLAGFATHADLDRHAHPYIICRAGWVRHGEPSTQRFRRCHPLLERLLDVAALRARRGCELADFEFLANVSCGEQLPYSTLKMLVKGINDAYPAASYKSRNRSRIENAYADSMRFYTLTNHRDSRLRERVLAIDRREGYRHRRSAVFHFADAGADLDPANLAPAAVAASLRPAGDQRPQLSRPDGGRTARGGSETAPPAEPHRVARQRRRAAGGGPGRRLDADGRLVCGACRPVRRPGPGRYPARPHLYAGPLPAAAVGGAVRTVAPAAGHGGAGPSRRPGDAVSDAATRGFVRGTERDRGFEQVARFLLLIGAEQSAQALAHLADREVIGIAREVAALGPIDAREQKRTMQEFGYPVPTAGARRGRRSRGGAAPVARRLRRGTSRGALAGGAAGSRRRRAGAMKER